MKQETKNEIRQFVRYKNFEEMLEALHVDADVMQDLVDTHSLRELVIICKIAGLTMYHNKLINCLRAGGIKFETEVGRKALSNEEKIERYKQKILNK